MNYLIDSIGINCFFLALPFLLFGLYAQISNMQTQINVYWVAGQVYPQLISAGTGSLMLTR